MLTRSSWIHVWKCKRQIRPSRARANQPLRKNVVAGEKKYDSYSGLCRNSIQHIFFCIWVMKAYSYALVYDSSKRIVRTYYTLYIYQRKKSVDNLNPKILPIKELVDILDIFYLNDTRYAIWRHWILVPSFQFGGTRENKRCCSPFLLLKHRCFTGVPGRQIIEQNNPTISPEEKAFSLHKVWKGENPAFVACRVDIITVN